VTSTSSTTPETSEFSKERQEAHNLDVAQTLAKLAGGSLKVNDLFRDRKDGQSYIEKPPSMTVEDVVAQGAAIIKANAETVEFTKQFKARPNDGAVAFAQVLTETYGFGAVGKTVHSFFGSQRPEYKTVSVGFDENGVEQTVEVPWGLMQFAPLQAEFTLYYTIDVDYGFCFVVSVSAPKKNQAAITGLFMLVEEYLKRNSIYKGKALYGVGRANPKSGEVVEPEFVNVYNVDRNKIVYTERVQRALDYSIFGIIEKTDIMRTDDVKIGKKVLLHGPNGSGKTAGAILAMQYAIENGWTAIRARYDEDLPKVVAFAERVGTPCVVVVEDCEKLMVPANAEVQEMDHLLDLFDGAGAKNREVMLLMTSNHVTELTRSMTRAGRIDRMVEISTLDRPAFERLFEVTIAPERLDNLDYDRLFEAFPECAPVWITEAMERVRAAAIVRSGEAGAKFITEDFLYEAEGLREHLDVHRQATDRKPKSELGEVIAEIVADVVDERLLNHSIDLSTFAPGAAGDILVKSD
jgi:hypothetical protein